MIAPVLIATKADSVSTRLHSSVYHDDIYNPLLTCADGHRQVIEGVVGDLIRTVLWDYPAFHLTMHCYWCALESSVTLLEHEAARWLRACELRSVRWLPADDLLIAQLERNVSF